MWRAPPNGSGATGRRASVPRTRSSSSRRPCSAGTPTSSRSRKCAALPARRWRCARPGRTGACLTCSGTKQMLAPARSAWRSPSGVNPASAGSLTLCTACTILCRDSGSSPWTSAPRTCCCSSALRAARGRRTKPSLPCWQTLDRWRSSAGCATPTLGSRQPGRRRLRAARTASTPTPPPHSSLGCCSSRCSRGCLRFPRQVPATRPSRPSSPGACSPAG
mmetsp:Transcript_13705/g.52208  ORF Transcript_13705/g.52208 Transcript_13705/m.52208 type:complete len:220 (-) Transcript_13705:1022-1681(-)